MRLLLVRHAAAVEAENFAGPDLRRPLTPAGRRAAADFFRRLRPLLSGTKVLLSSEAVRAVATADLLARLAPRARRQVAPALNPGCRWPRLRAALAAAGCGPDTQVAVVGHEPDLSRLLARLVAGGRLSVKLRKGSVALVEVDERGRGELRLLVDPRSCPAPRATRS